MTGPTDRLAELGLTLPAVPAPAGAYVPALRTGSLIYTSGQLPMVDGSLMLAGTVGDDVSVEQAAECARVAALNALAAVAAASGGLEEVTRVVKVVVFVASSPTFTAQPAVANGASDLLVEIFGDAGRHARSAVGVSALPSGTPVEVELIVEVASRPTVQLA